MELTPRTSESDGDPGQQRQDRRRWLPLAVIAMVLVVLGLLVTQGLAESTLYFRNADEAVAQRDSLGTKRFRLQGTVVGEPTEEAGEVRFDVQYNGVTVPVRHLGDPPELFRPDVPVVLEGHWAEGVDRFDSDRIMVKHDETYEAKDDYDERVRQADQGGEAP